MTHDTWHIVDWKWREQKENIIGDIGIMLFSFPIDAHRNSTVDVVIFDVRTVNEWQSTRWSHTKKAQMDSCGEWYLTVCIVIFGEQNYLKFHSILLACLWLVTRLSQLKDSRWNLITFTLSTPIMIRDSYDVDDMMVRVCVCFGRWRRWEL